MRGRRGRVPLTTDPPAGQPKRPAGGQAAASAGNHFFKVVGLGPSLPCIWRRSIQLARAKPTCKCGMVDSAADAAGDAVDDAGCERSARRRDDMARLEALPGLGWGRAVNLRGLTQMECKAQLEGRNWGAVQRFFAACVVAATLDPIGAAVPSLCRLQQALPQAEPVPSERGRFTYAARLRYFGPAFRHAPLAEPSPHSVAAAVQHTPGASGAPARFLTQVSGPPTLQRLRVAADTPSDGGGDATRGTAEPVAGGRLRAPRLLRRPH